jgi:Ferric reductase like transmembrane component/Ferric reductase NAD binding domain
MLCGVLGPMLLASTASVLLLTNHKLPNWRLSWIQKTLSSLRRHRDDVAKYGHDIAMKKNQFGRGEANFNVMAVWLIVFPQIIGVFAYIPSSLKYADERAAEEGLNPMQLRVEYISYLFGWGSTMCLVFFLIPVTRHSILLAAMGWSPILALRIHVWSGYLAFIYMFLHGIMLVPVWFIYYDYPVWQQIIPNNECWTWKESNVDIVPSCNHVFYNWTGIVAAIFFIVLWGSSLHWFRRRNYRLFYLFHIIFGTLTLLGIILHMHWFIIYLIPSMTYYLASTMPTLVQALASRFRGGVKVRQAVVIPDSGGCFELHFEAHDTALEKLTSEPCMFVKVCVPKISLVWHPFDVYKGDDSTVRCLIRPVGPFTKKFAEFMTRTDERPITLVDGFYSGADKSEEAIQHDCVTIVAGGVAITPFLTLLPALLDKIKSSDGIVKTKVIAVHWACREAGLCSFIVENYINQILLSARFIANDVNLTFYIYKTGVGVKSIESSSESSTSENMTAVVETKNGDNLEAAEKGVNKDDIDSEAIDKSQTFPSGNIDKKDSVIRCSPRQSWSIPFFSTFFPSESHPLELARMIPGRFSSPIWNIPLFVSFSFAIWFGFWFFFTQDNFEVESYYNLSRMTWVTIYGVLMYIGFGIVIEVTVLGLRNYWPKPSFDSFNVVYSRALPSKTGTDQGKDLKDVEIDTDDYCPKKNINLIYRNGRPTEVQIFEDAKKAIEPGIFMCGPTLLTQMVKKEASKENSIFGLT